MKTRDDLGIPCPACGKIGDQGVIDTRAATSSVYRRRRCSCGEAFATFEISEGTLYALRQGDEAVWAEVIDAQAFRGHSVGRIITRLNDPDRAEPVADLYRVDIE